MIFSSIVVSVVVAIVSRAVSVVGVSVVVTATAAFADSNVLTGECGFFFLVTRVHPFSWLLLMVVLVVLLLLMEPIF